MLDTLFWRLGDYIMISDISVAFLKFLELYIIVDSVVPDMDNVSEILPVISVHTGNEFIMIRNYLQNALLH